MKTVYVCSPYRSNNPDTLRKNIDYAINLTRRVAMSGYLPITPHLYLTRALDDEMPSERQVGLNIGIELLRKCDCILVGNMYGTSVGMEAEIAEAEVAGIPVFYETKLLDVLN